MEEEHVHLGLARGAGRARYEHVAEHSPATGQIAVLKGVLGQVFTETARAFLPLHDELLDEARLLATYSVQ